MECAYTIECAAAHVVSKNENLMRKFAIKERSHRYSLNTAPEYHASLVTCKTCSQRCGSCFRPASGERTVASAKTARNRGVCYGPAWETSGAFFPTRGRGSPHLQTTYPINFSPFGALSDTGTFLHANRSLRLRPSRSMFSRCWFSRCWRCLARRTYTDNSTPSVPFVRSR
jgi:hypothetical protein